MKKIVNYIVATLLLVSGYTTVNAQYNEGGGGFIFAPTTTPTRPVNKKPKPKKEVIVPTEGVVFKSISVHYSRQAPINFPSDLVSNRDCEYGPCNDSPIGPIGPIVPGPIPVDPERPSDRPFDNPINSPSGFPTSNPINNPINNPTNNPNDRPNDIQISNPFDTTIKIPLVINPQYDPNSPLASPFVIHNPAGVPRGYQYSFPNNSIIEVSMIRLIQEFNFSGFGFTNLAGAIQSFSQNRAQNIFKALARDIQWDVAQKIDKDREALLKINSILASTSLSQSERNQFLGDKKRIFNRIKEQYRIVNGFRHYNSKNLRAKIFSRQVELFFGKEINSLEDLSYINNRLSDLKDNGDQSFAWETTPENKKTLFDGIKASGKPEIAANENIDYGLLVLEAKNRFQNESTKLFVSWLEKNRQDVIEYLNVNKSSRAAAFCMRYLHDTWRHNEPFVTNTSRYKSNTTPRLQSASNPNLAISTKLTSAAINDGYVGFSNIMESFFDNISGPTDKMYKFEGKIIADIFKTNNLGGITNTNLNDSRFLINIGKSFDFSNVTNGLGLDIVFANDLGSILRSNGFNTTEVIKEIGKGNDVNSKIFAPKFKFPVSKLSQYKNDYPNFVDLIENRIQCLLKDPNFTKSLVENSGYSVDQLKRIFKFNDGADIEIGDVAGFADGDTPGLQDPTISRNLIVISDDFIKNEFESSNLNTNSVEGVMNYLRMSIIIAHEVNHHGDLNLNDGNFFKNGDEPGNNFEASYYENYKINEQSIENSGLKLYVEDNFSLLKNIFSECN